MKKRVINIIYYIGRPCAGKTTSSKKLDNNKTSFHFSTGEIMREEMKAETELGKILKEQLTGKNLGKLAKPELSSAITFSAIKKKVESTKGTINIILDGFPRDLKQKQFLDQHILDYEKDNLVKMEKQIIILDVSKENIIKRMLNRRDTSEVKRLDDTPEVLESRIKIYEDEISEIIAHTPMDKKIYIKGDGSEEYIVSKLKGYLKQPKANVKKNLQ